MSLINRDKGTTGNSGVAGKNFTVTGLTSGRYKVHAIRTEWTAPRKGDMAHRAPRRPGR